jgi:hypothetical protein
MRININSGTMAIDVTMSLAEMLTATNRAYRYFPPRFTFASPAYYVMSFKTPPATTGFIIYSPVTTTKTGDDIDNILYENPTITGGNVFNWVNLNLNGYGVVPVPMTSNISGLSTGATAITLTGGVEVGPSSYVPGISQGNSFSAIASSGQGDLVLKPDTVYALKTISLGNATKTKLIYTVYFIPIGDIK